MRVAADMERGFAVVGLGYVGLPVALALAKKFAPVIGFDVRRSSGSRRCGREGTRPARFPKRPYARPRFG